LPLAWKPRSIYGGVDDEGANNLVAQRLAGVIELDGFEVSHTKDAVLFSGDEEEVLEKYLVEATKDYRTFAQGRRGERGQGFSREKVQDILQSLRSEFVNDEFADTLNTSILPPLDTIIANNRQQVASLSVRDRLVTFDIFADLKVAVSEQERSEYDPYVTISADAEPGTIHVIINGLHPYYSSVESADAMEECMRQYLYDAIAEYRVSKQQGRVNPDSVRRLKDSLLRAKLVRIENEAASARDKEAPAADQQE
jgi:hypothetical protein